MRDSNIRDWHKIEKILDLVHKESQTVQKVKYKTIPSLNLDFLKTVFFSILISGISIYSIDLILQYNKMSNVNNLILVLHTLNQPIYSLKISGIAYKYYC